MKFSVILIRAPICYKGRQIHVARLRAILVKQALVELPPANRFRSVKQKAR